MAVGDEAKVAVESYVALGKEGTFGTYSSATTAIEALSVSFKTEIESQKLDTLNFNRGFTKRVQLNKNVAGTLEQNVHPEESVLLFTSALGGQITTTSLTSAATHSISSGNFDNSVASLSFNIRKGDSATWRFQGGRTNSLKLSANVGELLKASYDMIFQDATQQADDISAILSISTALPFTYVNGTYRYAANEAAAATSTVAENIQGFELNINNNLVSDNNARELGSNVLSVLPATRREIEFTITQRFDTTTNWNRFIQATQGAAELFFEAGAITAEHNYQLTIRMPKLFMNTPDPELTGPNEVISSEITFDVLVDDPNTTTGRDIGVTFQNATQSI